MIALLCLVASFLALWGVTFALFPPFLRGIRSVAGRLARWLRAHARFGPWFGRLEPWRSYLPLVVAFGIGCALVLWTADAFVDIAAALKAKSPVVQEIDRRVHEWFGSHRTRAATTLFTSVTDAGDVAGMSALVLTVVAVLCIRRRFRWASYLAITAAGGAILNQLLKFHYVRQRPDLTAAVTGAMGWSFPSGHTMTGTIVLGALAYLVARSEGAWRRKSAVFAGLVTLALAIGVSRVYLGVHWASDVGAGFAAGALWVTATTTGYEVFRQYRLGRESRARLRAEASGGGPEGRSSD